MYSDLFDQLGASGGDSGNRNASSSNSNADTSLVSFKAGKMNLDWNDDAGSFHCEPNNTRGEVRIVWKDNKCLWQWYDRRDKKVVDSISLHDFPESTFERIELESKQNKDDRIYVWTQKPGQYLMYWMQDESDEKDDEYVGMVNSYLADPQSASPEDTTTGDRGTTTTAAAASNATSTAAAPTSTDQSQVDTLSNILQNLGMPQNADGSARTTNTTATTGQLTLEDLQGAMANMQQPEQPSAPPLSEIVTPEAIRQLMANDEVRNRLVQLLPEEQRSEQYLEDNLRSPQVQQTLRSLTQALLPDDTGNMDGFYSVLANFNLDPADGQDAMAQNNPIQAFLDALLASVQKEEESKEEGESKEEE